MASKKERRNLTPCLIGIVLLNNGEQPMRKKIRTMQIVDENTSQVIPNFIETSDPLPKIESKLKKILENARVDEWTGCKKIVTEENKKWDEPTYNCIFVEETDKGNIYHFGCFSSWHPGRFIVKKTYKTLRGAIRYLPKFNP